MAHKLTRLRALLRGSWRTLSLIVLCVVSLCYLVHLSVSGPDNQEVVDMNIANVFRNGIYDINNPANTNMEVSPATNFDEIEERVKHIRNLCSKNSKKFAGKSPVSMAVKSQMHALDSNVMFCKVAKIASTFWSRIIYMETHDVKSADPFDVSMAQLNSFNGEKVPKIKNTNLGRNILWVREPYARLFAVYVDKVYAPNPTYWGYIGRPAISMFRKGKKPRCAHDLSFAEFVKFAIFSETDYPQKKRDIHFIPIHDTCKPCTFNYSFVGKMEHFGHDAEYTLRKLGLQKYVPYMENMTKPYEKDALFDTVQSVFLWKSDITKCMSFDEALRRVWRKLQIRGLLSRLEQFPLRENQSKSVSLDLFLKVAEHLNQGYTQEERMQNRMNRQEALIQAYSTVPTTDLEKLQKVYARDFELFGYDPKPDFIYNRKRTVHRDYFLDFNAI